MVVTLDGVVRNVVLVDPRCFHVSRPLAQPRDVILSATTDHAVANDALDMPLLVITVVLGQGTRSRDRVVNSCDRVGSAIEFRHLDEVEGGVVGVISRMSV